MKKYLFEIEITEGSDEFWEEIKDTGCDEVKDLLSRMMSDYGFFDGENCTIKLKSFKDE